MKRKKCQVTRRKELFYYVTSGSNVTRDVHWCVTVDYQQIANDNIGNQIHGFAIDYGQFILIIFILQQATVENIVSTSRDSRKTAVKGNIYRWADRHTDQLLSKSLSLFLKTLSAKMDTSVPNYFPKSSLVVSQSFSRNLILIHSLVYWLT